ncbi:putative helicase, PIF1 family (DUF889 domain) [Campylobacter iguaniorum]|uniref:ATP-dependent DNA helicase n=1 Tax=Campylobacter iguaniorum TaxID=1244531 RepID=UPI00073A42CC|nr:AAA family ATPase [Campylobacter iguaniorum]ALV24221.1 putative helicase, PIF1 family (DUF889 domain) [Campylobacter iguaniorum]
MLYEILEILSRSNLFLTGGGGVGKSYITKEIIHAYKKAGKNIVILGSTGISAVGIGGVSCHSFFKFGISSNFEELKLLDRKQRGKLSELKKIIESCDLLIIDEVSMISSELMEMINYRLISFKFRGRILLVGDFYQLPPVKKTDPNALFSFNYAFSSSAWNGLNLCNVELLLSKRTSDLKFYELLSRIRIGEIDSEICEFLNSRLVEEIPKDMTVLFGRNYDADRLNEQRLSQIDAKLENLVASVDIYDTKLSDQAIDKWINNLNSPYELKLKIGAKAMFLANKWGEYFNGEQGVVVDFIKNENIIQSILVKKDNDVIIEVEPCKYELYDFGLDGDEVTQNIRASFMQFPLKLAYAITIHKSQGMSIERFACSLDHIFANGQLYVALSRATNPNGLYLYYSKSANFQNYLKSVVKIDNEVRDFYENTKFIKENI